MTSLQHRTPINKGIHMGVDLRGRTTLNGGQVQISRPNRLEVSFAKYAVMLCLLYWPGHIHVVTEVAQ